MSTAISRHRYGLRTAAFFLLLLAALGYAQLRASAELKASADEPIIRPFHVQFRKRRWSTFANASQRRA